MSSTDDRSQLVAYAASYLRSVGCTWGKFTITLTRGREMHIIPITEPPADPSKQRFPATPRADAPPGAKWLSPLEVRILATLEGREWTPADTLAGLLGESVGGDIKPICRNLVERGILESAPSRGYRMVKPPEEGVKVAD